MAEELAAAGGGENSKRGNDWEVVSLTASAYAASPGPKQVDLKEEDNKDAQTSSHPLYMSGHFVFPPTEIDEDNKASKKMDFGFSLDQETGSPGKAEEDLTLKGLELSDGFAGLEFLEQIGKRGENISMSGLSSLQDETAIGGSHVHEHHNEPTESVTPSVVSDDTNTIKDENEEVANNISPPPCEAWWKRSAASLISQAKETNTVWSIFIAAAVMGIVILGQKWQRERWQVLQLKWESSNGNEKGGRLIGPMYRLKQAFVGGQRRDSFIRVTSHNDT